MNFSQALELMKTGKPLTRAGWNGKGMWVSVHKPWEDEAMTEPYLYMKTAQGGVIPWLASHTDLLSDDWSLLDIKGLPR